MGYYIIHKTLMILMIIPFMDDSNDNYIYKWF